MSGAAGKAVGRGWQDGPERLHMLLGEEGVRGKGKSGWAAGLALGPPRPTHVSSPIPPMFRAGLDFSSQHFSPFPPYFFPSAVMLRSRRQCGARQLALHSQARASERAPVNCPLTTGCICPPHPTPVECPPRTPSLIPLIRPCAPMGWMFQARSIQFLQRYNTLKATNKQPEGNRHSTGLLEPLKECSSSHRPCIFCLQANWLRGVKDT